MSRLDKPLGRTMRESLRNDVLPARQYDRSSHRPTWYKFRQAPPNKSKSPEWPKGRFSRYVDALSGRCLLKFSLRPHLLCAATPCKPKYKLGTHSIPAILIYCVFFQGWADSLVASGQRLRSIILDGPVNGTEPIANSNDQRPEITPGITRLAILCSSVWNYRRMLDGERLRQRMVRAQGLEPRTSCV